MNKEMTDEEFYSIQDIEELVDMCLTKDHNLKILQSQLEQQLSQLQQDNENLRITIKNDDIAINNLCNEIRQLKQGKEELIKHCENEIYSQKESIELLSNKKYADIHIGAINAYKNVLSKLKDSDKNDC